MRVRYDTLDVSLFITLHDYDPAMPWDIEGDIFLKKKAPAARERLKEILTIRK